MNTRIKPLCLLVTCCLSAPTIAQLSPSDATATDDEPERITVTARKRAEGMLEVPLAVSALGEEAIERNAVNTLADLQNQIPALTIYGE